MAVDGLAVAVLYDDIHDNELRSGVEHHAARRRAGRLLSGVLLGTGCGRKKCAECQGVKTVDTEHHGCTNCSG
jgi:hypothetical protein